MSADSPDFEQIKAQTADVYDRQAAAWDARRANLNGENIWLDRMFSDLPQQCDVLDLGCGTGRPLAAYILNQGHRLTGLDQSTQMIALARTRFPLATWHLMDMCVITLTEQFDAVLSWDGFFHLSPTEQRAALPAIASRVRDAGTLLLTIGRDHGLATGTVNGETVYHASLSHTEYTDILIRAGFESVTITPNDQDVLGRTVLLARNKRTAP
ncbi:class I SAM-dependent DNA methyltransferase [Shimia abyssi]|uniref:SAM-dependent methyltransferase n=1 Tax=Shimia abyssi TaxID=1662395 RepID=A0A2P8FBC5_9RHOB|nr:class I SAM-dependent methyltransferase [Shimia abyssi]PSL18962.1 SAM-dependent methyltransferase [Shimia abyssi]